MIFSMMSVTDIICVDHASKMAAVSNFVDGERGKVAREGKGREGEGRSLFGKCTLSSAVPLLACVHE